MRPTRLLAEMRTCGLEAARPWWNPFRSTAMIAEEQQYYNDDPKGQVCVSSAADPPPLGPFFSGFAQSVASLCAASASRPPPKISPHPAPTLANLRSRPPASLRANQGPPAELGSPVVLRPLSSLTPFPTTDHLSSLGSAPISKDWGGERKRGVGDGWVGVIEIHHSSGGRALAPFRVSDPLAPLDDSPRGSDPSVLVTPLRY